MESFIVSAVSYTTAYVPLLRRKLFEQTLFFPPKSVTFVNAHSANTLIFRVNVADALFINVFVDLGVVLLL